MHQTAELAHKHTAEAFVAARRTQRGLSHFPGQLPNTLADAYAIQSLATAAWPDALVGWKVGRILSPLDRELGANRFIGPVFARTVFPAAQPRFLICPDGRAAFEAELVAVLGEDAPAGQEHWTASEARALVAALHVGVEIAGSPCASLDKFGPLAFVAAFGSNTGMILGDAIAGWPDVAVEDIRCTTSIDGAVIATGSAADLPGGPFEALAFALAQAARLGRPLRQGQHVLTGAITGVHAVVLGQRCSADFGAFGRIDCVTVAGRPDAL